MSVFFWKPRKKWVTQWTEEGKQKRRYFSTENEALACEADRLHPEENQNLTLGELVALFFRANTNKHEKTKRNIVYFLTGHSHNGKHIEGAGEFLCNTYAESLTRMDLERMRESLRFRKASNATINKYQAYIRAILAWGVDQQLIFTNPWREFKRLPVQKKQITTTMADFQTILKHCPEWLQWAFATAYALAMRPGNVELFSLLWASFNWRHGYVQYAQGKTGRVKRVYPPLTYWAEAERRYKEDMAAGIPWVCHKKGKKVLDYKTAWQKAVREAGMQGKGIRPYDIRHIAASEMLAAGADLAAVAAQMGHASIQTTATTYAHVTPGSQARAAALMPSLRDEK